MSGAQKSRLFLRLVASVLIPAFLLQEVSWAAPEIRSFDLSFSTRPEIRFDLPYSVAFIEDTYKAPSSQDSRLTTQDKTIILIQDAHTNESSETNIAKALDLILEKEDIRYVFVEAGFGDASLSFLRKKAPLPARESVALSFLRKGLLHGAEYMDLTSDKVFSLWGVEKRELYEKAVETYRDMVGKRAAFKDYLDRVESTFLAIKPKVYNASLLEFDEKHEQFLMNEIPLTDFLKILDEEAAARNISLDRFPHWKELIQIRKLSERVTTLEIWQSWLKGGWAALAAAYAYLCKASYGK